MFERAKTWLRQNGGDQIIDWLVERRIVHGLTVELYNTRPDIESEHVFVRLEQALALIGHFQPYHLRRMRRDFARLVVRRFPCRGAYFPESRICLVELTFVVNPEFTPAQVAATILHEAMHARLDNAGVVLREDSKAKHERFCRKAEVEFGRLVPGGEAIVERAIASLALDDEGVAPSIDWREAARRVQQVDDRRGA